MATEFPVDFKVLEHLRGYPDDLRRYSNLLKQVHPRGVSAVAFLLKRPPAPDDFVETVCRLVQNGEEIMNVVEAADAAHMPPQMFLDEVASRPDFPEPLFRSGRKIVWRKADVERYLAEHLRRVDG